MNLDSDEKISAVFPLSDFEEAQNLMMFTKNGVVKKTPLSEFQNIRQNGLIAIAIREDDELIAVLCTRGEDNIMIGTKQGMSITFSEEDVRPMGRTAMGVRGIKLREGDEVIDAGRIKDDYSVLIVSENGYGKRTPVTEYNAQSRGGIGVKTMNVTEKTGYVCGMKIVSGEEDIMLINEANAVIRMGTAEIPTIGRTTQGVRVMRMDEDIKVVTVALLPKEEEIETEITEETEEIVES